MEEKVTHRQATLRDGTTLKINDEVECTAYPQCAGQTFIICEITPWPHCESGFMVVAFLKGDPERKIKGFQKEGIDLGPAGIDSNHFVKVKP